MPYITSIERRGIEKGIEKVARRMFQAGYSVEEIREVTELSEEELEALRLSSAPSSGQPGGGA